MTDTSASRERARASSWSPRVARGLNIAIGVTAAAMAVYHMFSTQVLLFDAIQHQNNHLFFALVLSYLLAIKNLKRKRFLPVVIALLVVSIAGTAYVAIFYKQLQARAGYQTTLDVIIGTLIVIVALEACREAFGWALPVLAIIFFLYAWFGHFIPGVMRHFPMTYPRVITSVVMGFMSGLYGEALAVSANYILLFVLFGGLIQVSGAPRLFIEIGKLAGRRLKGGPAQTAVVSSCLIGMVTGSAMANVAMAGSFTIPLMKKVGYQPYQAGGIEAAASTGSQIMPPIMGATAFLMVGIIGIQYIQLVFAAFIPGFLYFLAIGIYCELQAKKQNLVVAAETVNFRLLLILLPIFLVPLTLLMVLLLKAYTATFAIFWAIVATVVMGWAIPQARPRLKEWFEGLQSGIISGAGIGVACATVGVIMGVMLVTGLGLKLSAQLEVWSLGNLWLAAIIAMVMALILGMGLPPLAAYLMVAIMAAPVFLHWNVPLLQSHFFVFYFSAFSVLTPPVALAGMVASKIAESPYVKTSFEGFKISIVAFLMPYVFLVNPTILGRPPDVVVGVLTFIAVLLALVGICTFMVGYYFTRMTVMERALGAVYTILLMLYATTMQNLFFVAGAILFAVATFWQWRHSKAADRQSGQPALKALEGN